MRMVEAGLDEADRKGMSSQLLYAGDSDGKVWVTAREGWQRELEDPEPIIEGSFDEVVSAYHRGRLSGDEYEVLSQAASEAVRREES